MSAKKLESLIEIHKHMTSFRNTTTQKEEDQDVGGWTILKWILEK
jgi:hypothetical protein